MENERMMLYLQGFLGLVFVVVGVLGSSYNQLSCEASTKQCTVKKKLFGMEVKTLGTYHTQEWRKAKVGKIHDQERNVQFYVLIQKKRTSFRLLGFDTRERSIVEDYVKAIQTYMNTKAVRFSISSQLPLFFYFILFVFYGGGIWFLWASFRGEVLEE